MNMMRLGPPGLSTIFDRYSSNFALNFSTCFLVGVFVSCSFLMLVDVVKSGSSRVKAFIPYCFDPCKCRMTVRWIHLDFGSFVICPFKSQFGTGPITILYT